MKPISDFLDGEKEIGGLTFRPFTFGTKAACIPLGLTLFTGGGQPQDETESERQIAAFTWLHTAPLSEILTALRNGSAATAIEAFAFELPYKTLPAIVSEINRVFEAAKEAAVDVVSKPGSADGGAPGN